MQGGDPNFTKSILNYVLEDYEWALNSDAPFFLWMWSLIQYFHFSSIVIGHDVCNLAAPPNHKLLFAPVLNLSLEGSQLPQLPVQMYKSIYGMIETRNNELSPICDMRMAGRERIM